MEKFNKKRKILNDWLAKYKETKEFAVDVSRVIDLTNEQIEIVKNIPANHEDIKNKLENIFTSDIDYLETVLPDIETPTLFIDSSVNAMAVSGSTAGYGYIQSTYDSDLTNWRTDSLSSLASIQDSQDRFDKIIAIVHELDNDIANEFTQAKEIFPLFKQSLAGPEELGTLFRNPMEHLQGRLWERTKKIYKTETGRKLQEKIQWATIAEYIAKNGIGSFEYKELIDRSADFKELFGFLSSLLKKCATYTSEHIIEQIQKYIDTIYSILTLSDIEKMKNAL